MAKVTEQDVINFLKEKVTHLRRELELAQNALNALEGTSSPKVAPKNGKKQDVGEKTSLAGKKTAKAAVKRGRKPNVKKIPSERILAADQLG